MFSRLCVTASLPISATLPFLWQHQIKAENNNDSDELIHVHIFHRHGHRTPYATLTEPVQEETSWIPHISSHYSAYHPEDKTPLVPHHRMYSWDNIDSKLKGMSLAFKEDNWNKSSPTIIQSDSSTLDKLAEYSTDDNACYGNHPFLGQLTDKGVTALENVGKYLRGRYVDDLGFLPSEYDVNDSNLHYHSTNMARTIQSADSLLQQLYPMNHRVDNARVPLHIDLNMTYLNPGRMGKFCDRLKDKMKSNHGELYSNIDDKFEKMTTDVLDHFEVDPSILKNEPVDIVFDHMACRLSHDGPETPDHFQDEHLDEMGQYVADLHLGKLSMDRETLRLSWGNVNFKMMELMKSANVGDRGMHIKSCHDTSLMCVLSSIYGQEAREIGLKWPNYGSFVIFEVWQRMEEHGKQRKYVKVLYNGEPLKAFDGEDCIPLDELEKRWSDIMIDEKTYFEEECLCS